MTEKLIAKQYNQHIYPHPIQDLKAHAEAGGAQEGEPRLYSSTIWPTLPRMPDEGKILIAGCGTHQAAYYAYHYPEWSVVGIDLSDESLAHQQYLKEKHALDNLELKTMSLLQSNALNAEFDFIVSTGVLHHLVDPVLGLKALSSSLRDDGCILLMVYGASLRTGVYMLQDAFSRLGTANQNISDIELVRATLKSLPSEHAVRRYLSSTSEKEFDTAIVDTFLNPQDTSYDVAGVMTLVQSSGLKFHAWVDRGRYTAKIFHDQAHPIFPRLANLTEQDKFSVAEKLNQNLGTHFFYCKKPDTEDPDVLGLLRTDKFLDLVPIMSHGVKSRGTDSVGRSLYAKDNREFWILPEMSEFFLNCGSANDSTIGELIDASPAARDFGFDRLREFFVRQFEFGIFTFRCHRLK